MKTIIVTILSFVTFLSSEVTYSQMNELQIKFLKRSGKKVRLDNLENDKYTYLKGEDEYILESILFVNCSISRGLKVTRRNEKDDTDEVVFYSLDIHGDYIKKKNSGEYVFTLNLQQFNLGCCGDLKYQIIDSESKQVLREFTVSQEEKINDYDYEGD